MASNMIGRSNRTNIHSHQKHLIKGFNQLLAVIQCMMVKKIFDVAYARYYCLRVNLV